MKRGGGFAIAAACAWFLLSGISSPFQTARQGSETETETSTASDLFIPTSTGTETGTPIDTDTPLLTPSETATATATETLTETPGTPETRTQSPTGTDTPSQTIEGTLTDTPALSPTLTPTSTSSLTNSPTTDSPPWVIISEVGWAGTRASASDEWIELWNPGAADADLAGWTLTDGGDILVPLSGTIGAGGFFLLERTDDTTVADIIADRIYTGALANAGESLFLIDPSGRTVDTANGDGGPWPAGSQATAAAMERTGAGSDTDSEWCSNNGIHRNGSDAAGYPINGTPRAPFSGLCLEPTRTRTRTPTSTGSGTATFTPTPTVTLPPPSYPPHSLVINEVAWSGTAADANDEWIELWNPGGADIDLAGWVLTDGGDISVTLAGSIGPGDFFILERGGDDALSDISANRLYTGALSNSGEVLTLLDPAGGAIDIAGGRAWPGGTGSPVYASLERGLIDPPGWGTNTGWVMNGRDAAGHPVRGTPGRANSVLSPTPTATKLPKGVLINEFLPKPGSDWNRDGSVDYNDEFIELLNVSAQAVDIGGWMLDDDFHGGSRKFVIPGGTWIEPNRFLVFFRTQTHIALNDPGDEVWLLSPGGGKIDGRVYTRTRWPDSAWDRFPDGESVLRLGFPPTPGEPNRLPDDILNPKKNPLPLIAAGWRRVMCGPSAGPLLVGEGFLTTGDEDSIRMAEASGWYSWWNGRCYAWSAPSLGKRLPSTNLLPGSDSVLENGGWWWEWWYLR
ncbi:MAG: lamin tail domain-containing protein [Anaerolineales bacterium]